MSVCVLDADSLRVAVGTCHKEVVGCLAWASRASHCLRDHFHSSSLLEEREGGMQGVISLLQNISIK